MDLKKQYITRQRRALLAFLSQRQEQLFSAEELMLALGQQGENVGLATVYRNLDKMVSQDMLARIIPSDGSGAKYEYLETRALPDSHYHMVCEECGRILHINCSRLAQLADHIESDHDFVLDSRRTILYGRCRQCAKKPQ